MTQPKIFSKSYPLNRLLATVLARKEFKDVITFRGGKLKSVEEVDAGVRWLCTLDDGTSFDSNYPPIVRHGIDINHESDSGDFDLRTLRMAVSRAPVPFKPFDF
jgi:hypothetical protein